MSEFPTNSALPESANLFELDDTLNELQKCERCLASQLPLQRLVYTKKISSVVREFGVAESFERLLPLISRLASDKEMVIRSALTDELGELAVILAKNDAPRSSLSAPSSANNINNTSSNPNSNKLPLAAQSLSPYYPRIEKSILPILEKLLIDDAQEVKQSASNALIKIAGVMQEEHVGSIILTKVLCLAHDENDERKIAACHILSELAHLLGSNLCQNFVALELASFADDPIFKVRKAAAQAFANVAKVAGSEFTAHKLLPHYLKLTRDSIWGVRKCCVDSLVGLTEVVSPEVRQSQLIPVFEGFSSDSSRWVRNAAFEILGPFIHALGEPLVKPALLKRYTQIPHMSSAVVDTEAIFHCAYNFPAVVATLGASRFEELAETFNALVHDTKPSIRATLSHSLHEIAKMIGPDLTQTYLLSAFDIFLHDLDEVRIGIVSTLAKFLSALHQQKRTEYLDVLFEIAAGSEQIWRWRHILAKFGVMLILSIVTLHFVIVNSQADDLILIC